MTNRRPPPLIAPSLLAADFGYLADQIERVEKAGADWLHIDVMDGRFVPNLTMGPVVVEACRRATALPLDVHLMVETPETLLQPFAEAGASSLTVHVETCPHLHRTLQQIRALGCRTGVAVNPGTPWGHLSAVLEQTDLVLIMTVNPGFGGQRFLPEVLPKVEAVAGEIARRALSTTVQVDGGIGPETIQSAWNAGADNFVAGTSVFRHPEGVEQGVRALKRSLGVI